MCLFVYIFAVFVVIKQKHWITFQFHWWGSSAVIFRALRVFHFDRGTSPGPFDAKILKMPRMHQGLKAVIKGWYWFVKGNMQAVCRVILNVGNVKFYLYWQQHFWYGDISASTSAHLLPSAISSQRPLCFLCSLTASEQRETGQSQAEGWRWCLSVSVCVGLGLCPATAMAPPLSQTHITLVSPSAKWMRVAELWLKVQTVYLSDFRSF